MHPTVVIVERGFLETTVHQGKVGEQSGSSDAAGRRLRRSVGVWRRLKCPRSEFWKDQNLGRTERVTKVYRPALAGNEIEASTKVVNQRDRPSTVPVPTAVTTAEPLDGLTAFPARPVCRPDSIRRVLRGSFRPAPTSTPAYHPWRVPAQRRSDTVGVRGPNQAMPTACVLLRPTQCPCL